LGNTINDWVAITKNEKSGWAQFYRELLGQPLSDIPRFMKAVADFGHGIMFDAILAASPKKLQGDPLNYVIGIAIAKAQQEAKEISDDTKRQLRLDRAKQRTMAQNEELEGKYERARKILEQKERDT
jgi:hypothetical protein